MVNVEEARKELGDNPITLDYDCGCKYMFNNRPLQQAADDIDANLIVWEMCRSHAETAAHQVKYNRFLQNPLVK